MNRSMLIRVYPACWFISICLHLIRIGGEWVVVQTPALLVWESEGASHLRARQVETVNLSVFVPFCVKVSAISRGFEPKYLFRNQEKPVK